MFSWRKRNKTAAAALTGLVLLIAGCALMLSGCGAGESKAKSGIRIGVTVYDQYDTFISQLMEAFKEDVNELSAAEGRTITLDIVDSGKSQSTQNDQVKALIDRGCDVVCVNLVDRTEPTTITDLAEKHDVPVIFFNRELVEEDLERWDKLYYVGADAFQSGILQGELVAEEFKKSPSMDRNGDGILQYVSLEGETGHQDAIVRTEYSQDTIMSAGIEVEKLSYAIANWSRAQAQTQFAAMLQEFGDRIELVLSNNDDMALGAIDALKAAEIDRGNWPVIIGIDGTEEGLAAVKSGEMLSTVYNDKEGQAEAMLKLAYALAAGEDLDGLGLTDGKYIRLPYTKVTGE